MMVSICVDLVRKAKPGFSIDLKREIRGSHLPFNRRSGFKASRPQAHPLAVRFVEPAGHGRQRC
jgi:hypothetical protein